jgi:cytochrome c553
MKAPLILLLLTLSLPVFADPGQDLFTKTCAACHGGKGEGKIELKTPSIASMPKWYIARQIHKFQTDVRGADAKDVTGLQMRAVAHTLGDDQIEAVAGWVESLPKTPTRHTLKGDAGRGRELYGVFCMECHRYNATGELVFGSPPLTGLQDWYILDQLLKFRAGVRGTHPEDEHGAKMHKRTNIIDQKDLIHLATFIAVLAEEYPEEKNKGK